MKIIVALKYTTGEEIYCARGEMENRIQKQQLDLFADRTSCSLWWPNQFRLLLSTLAYPLVNAIRRIRLLFSSGYPY